MLCHKFQYLVHFLCYNLNVTEYLIGITADDKSKTYGEADPSFTNTITSGSLQYDDSITGSLDRVSGETAGTYDIIQGTLSIDEIDNYDLDFVNGTLTIEQATTNLGLTSSEGWTLDSAGFSTITGINCPEQLTCNLYEEGVNVSNPYLKLFSAGAYDFKYNTTGNENYTSDSVSRTLYSQIISNETSNETEYCFDTDFAYNYLNNRKIKVCE